MKKQDQDPYVELEEDWVKKVDALIAAYGTPYGDREANHGEEDDLLERYVRERAYEEDPRAVELVRLLDTPRTRWYA